MEEYAARGAVLGGAKSGSLLIVGLRVVVVVSLISFFTQENHKSRRAGEENDDRLTDDDDDDDDDDPQYIIEDETLLYVSETEERPTHQIADLNHLTWAETWDRLVKMEQMGLVKRGHHEGRTTWAKS